MVSPCGDGTFEVMELIAGVRFEALCCSAATLTIVPFNVHRGDRGDRAETWHRIAFRIPLCINGFRHRYDPSLGGADETNTADATTQNSWPEPASTRRTTRRRYFHRPQ